MRFLIRLFLIRLILRSSSLRRSLPVSKPVWPAMPYPSRLFRVWGAWVLIVPLVGCASNNGWDWSDLNPWSDDEPSYARLESDIIAAPEPGQPVQQPGVMAPPEYAVGVPAPSPGYGYYPPQPPPSYYGAPSSLGISPSGCPVPWQWSGYPPSYPSYPVQPPPAYMPPYSPQGYNPGAVVPGPASSRLTVSPQTQVSQEVVSEQELVRRYQVLNNCTNVGGNTEIGFYCDDYE